MNEFTQCTLAATGSDGVEPRRALSSLDKQQWIEAIPGSPIPSASGKTRRKHKRKHHTLATRLPISQPLVSPVSARHRLNHRSMRCRCSTEDDHQASVLCAGHDSSSQAVVYLDK
ncbi:hypothetical protein V8C44DRAFT_141978 [Trichoderma aethiopicum]